MFSVAHTKNAIFPASRNQGFIFMKTKTKNVARMEMLANKCELFTVRTDLPHFKRPVLRNRRNKFACLENRQE